MKLKPKWWIILAFLFMAFIVTYFYIAKAFNVQEGEEAPSPAGLIIMWVLFLFACLVAYNQDFIQEALKKPGP